MKRRYAQVDVFTPVPMQGNGLAVVLDGDGLSDAQMQGFTSWTNLAEATFIQRSDCADYRLRIFSHSGEMLFAGHPTLGSCAAWLAAGGRPARDGMVVQDCGVGLVEIDIRGQMPAFAAPETDIASLDDKARDAICAALGLCPEVVVRSARLCNGPIWQVIELASAEEVLAVAPFAQRQDRFRGTALIGPHAPGAPCDWEVRNLGPASMMSEDPITGSLNAAIAAWKYGTGQWDRAQVIAQGTALGRQGRVFTHCREGQVWIGGQSHILIEGYVTL